MTYWDRLNTQRVGRRRALLASGTTLAGAALLAACGGGKEDGTGPTQDATTLITKVVDETKSAKAGGFFRTIGSTDPPNLDPYGTNTNPYAPNCYNGLFRIKDGLLEPTKGEIEGDIVDSWEVSPDRVTITAKIKPGATFAPVAPVNGRTVDARDVAFSWQRFHDTAGDRADYANDVSPNAPIVSITAVDDRTVQVKLARPTVTVLAQLSRGFTGSFFIIPKEAANEGQLDIKRTMVGTGLYMLDSLQPSVGIKLKKNPNFKLDKNTSVPYIEQIEMVFLREYAAQLAQFRAGTLHQMSVRQEDILSLKKDLPDLEIHQSPLATRTHRTGFGMAPESPFRDERLRQAWVMTWDRDTYLKAVFNVDQFEAQGLPTQLVYESGLECAQAVGWQGWFMDPRKEKEFGANAKYFKFDVAEAKKLVAAAGLKDEITINYPGNSAGRPPTFEDGLQALISMTRDAGVFRVKERPILDYFGEYATRYRQQSETSNFDGVIIAVNAGVGGNDPAQYLFVHYNRAGSRRQGTDAQLDDMTTKATQEFDTGKRQELVRQIQQLEGQKQYYARIGGATGFSIAWPAVRNRDVYQGGTGRGNQYGVPSAYSFMDTSKAPEKKS